MVDYLTTSLGTLIICLSMSSLVAQQAAPAEAFIEALSETGTDVEEALPLITDQIDINSEDVGTLSQVGLISALQLQSLSLYISVNGELISLYELQSVPFFDLPTIRSILPFITVGHDDLSLANARTSVSTGKHEVTLRWRAVLQTQGGYLPDGAYTGDRNALLIRYLHSGRRITFGFMAEKDPGEPWFEHRSKSLMDFKSLHLAIRRPTKWLKEIIIGDYNASFGAGLIKNSTFSTGKSALTTSIYRTGQPIRPLRSAREYDFFRGVAMKIEPTPEFRLHMMASRHKIDATVMGESDSTGTDVISNSYISSLSSSGLHRTDSEMDRRARVLASALGLIAEIDLGKAVIQAHTLYQRTAIPVTIDNPTAPTGKSTVNSSLAFRYLYQNAMLFGEFALDKNGTANAIGGALIAFNKQIDIAFQFRMLSPRYNHFGARTFAENTKAENESGIYTGVELQPFQHWKLNASVDMWKHPARRFGIDYPSRGNEELARITFSKRNKFEYYVQWRSERKLHNDQGDRKLRQLSLRKRQYFRLHLSNNINKHLEIRSRFEYSQYQLGDHPAQKGIMIFQDLLYRPLGKPISITGRIAYFDIDTYDARIYAYENDLSYQFSVPAYSDNGTRMYLNLKYKGIRNTTIELRIAHTQMFDRSTIGSGNDMIEGKGKSDVKLQVVFRL